MNHAEQIQEKVDTIMRDEAYQGDYGPISDTVFNNMCARVATMVVDMLREEEVI
ncbi:hypothetical protein SEA_NECROPHOXINUS_90 [Microbacterium phage Necrophoxinus]|nr:hypothetical protein SEA_NECROPHOXINUS_90 [Microbacterium phage Necrophoxinus]